jgi:hypothetical protein
MDSVVLASASAFAFASAAATVTTTIIISAIANHTIVQNQIL